MLLKPIPGWLSLNSSWPSDAILWRQHIVWNPYIFHYERIPPNSRCCNFLKVDIIIFYNPLQKLRIFTFWLYLGGHFDEKNNKTIIFYRLRGENGHNSINIEVSALKLLAFDREPNFDQNQAKTRHYVAKKNGAELDFSCNLGENSRLFSIFRLKKGWMFNF